MWKLKDLVRFFPLFILSSFPFSEEKQERRNEEKVRESEAKKGKPIENPKEMKSVK